MTKRYIYIRDDDVYNLSNKFLKIFNFFLNEKIPVVYGIIPKKLSQGLVKFLGVKNIKYAPYFNITQHGWSHINHAGKQNTRYRYEFGPRRSYREQKKDILSGYLKMKEKFGRLFTPGFIPPYHFYDTQTLRIIDELEIPVFSAGMINYPPKQTKFLYLPAQISVNKYNQKFKSIPLSLAELSQKAAYFINKYYFTGAYFHHETLNRYNFDIFVKFIRFLKRKSACEPIKFILFSDILALYKGRL